MQQHYTHLTAVDDKLQALQLMRRVAYVRPGSCMAAGSNTVADSVVLRLCNERKEQKDVSAWSRSCVELRFTYLQLIRWRCHRAAATCWLWLLAMDASVRVERWIDEGLERQSPPH